MDINLLQVRAAAMGVELATVGSQLVELNRQMFLEETSGICGIDKIQALAASALSDVVPVTGKPCTVVEKYSGGDITWNFVPVPGTATWTYQMSGWNINPDYYLHEGVRTRFFQYMGIEESGTAHAIFDHAVVTMP